MAAYFSKNLKMSQVVLKFKFIDHQSTFLQQVFDKIGRNLWNTHKGSNEMGNFILNIVGIEGSILGWRHWHCYSIGAGELYNLASPLDI